LRSGQGNPTPYYASGQTRAVSGNSVTFTPGVRMLRNVSNGSAAVAARSGGGHLPAIRAGQTISSPSGGITVKAVSGTPSTQMQIELTLGSAAAPETSGDGTLPVYRFWSDTYQG